jgi:hypothetical protein
MSRQAGCRSCRLSSAHTQAGAAPAAAFAGRSPPGSRYGDRAWWAQRKEETLEPG